MRLSSSITLLLVLLTPLPLSAADLPPTERFRCLEDIALDHGNPDRDEDFGESLDLDGDTLVVAIPRSQGGGHAKVYVFEADAWRLQAELRPEDPADTDFDFSFPTAVALDGDVIVLGRAGSELAGEDSGLAHVFERVGEDWFETALLVPPDHAEDDRFGDVLDVDGDRIVVGAPHTSRFSVPDGLGAAHVFHRDGSGWLHEARLVPAVATDSGEVGRAVSIHGDRVAVGTGPVDNPDTTLHFVTLFERGPSGWTETQGLRPPVVRESELFGLSLDLDADRLIAGSPRHHDIFMGAGSAHVFVLRGGSWEHEARLLPPARFAHRVAGEAVAIEGELAVVGNRGNGRFGAFEGAAQLFRLEGGAWTAVDELRGSSAARFSGFGSALALSGARVAIGAPLERSSSREGDIDRVHLFSCRSLLIPACEAEEARRLEGASASAGVGQAVALDADSMAVGAPGEGVVMVLERDPSDEWVETATLVGSASHPNDRFGWSLALHGDTLVVGAPFHRQLGADAGAAWVFERGPSGAWEETAFLLAPDGEASDGFGLAVDVHLDTVAVGAHRDGDRGGAAGAVHVFVRAGSGWEHEAKLTADDGDGTEQLGFDLAVFGDVVMAGAHGEDRPDIGANSLGAVYAYRRSGTTWVQEQKLEAPEGGEGDQFGISVALDQGTVLIGAWRDGSGSAYTFRDSGGLWRYEDKLFASDPEHFRSLGAAVDLEGERAILGDPRHEGGGSQAGAALVFARVDGQWHEQQLLVDGSPEIIDRLGVSVAVSGDQLAAGAPLADGGVADAGRALLFRCESNLAPSCTAGVDIVASCDGVSLAASASDPDGDPIDLQWSSSCAGVSFLPSADVADPLVLFGSSCDVDCLLDLTVEDDRGLGCRDELRVLVRDEQPPSVEAPEPLILECEGPDGIGADDPRVLAWLAAASSDDDCGDTTLAHDAPPVFFPRCAGEPPRAVSFVATDACGNEAVASSSLGVFDTTPPDLVVPEPLLLECDGRGGLPAADPRIAAWLASAVASDTCSEVSVAHDAPDFFAAGCAPGLSTTVTFIATDACGQTVALSSELTVVDTTPPRIRRDESLLGCAWPPNGRWVRFLRDEVPVRVEDACDEESPSWWFVDCASNQPADGRGDGNRAPDCRVEAGGDSFAVRAERAGSDPRGRTYSAWIVASDGCGNESLPEIVGTVHVPHDRRPPRDDCRRGER